MINKTITILTPTYNRAKTLPRLYESLLRQDNKDFCWLIIDDGSTDETKKIVYDFISESKIDIKYFYKENGGKHTAINLGLDYVNTDLVFIVDSDDYLVNNAIGTIIEYYNKYKHLEGQICGFSFLKSDFNGRVIGDYFSQDEFISNYIDERIKLKIRGDKAEVFFTNILKKFKFPVIEGEKFLSESTIWIKMAFEYDMVFVNKVIYICEYLEDGLTRNSKKIRISNPKGAKLNAIVRTDRRLPFSERIKGLILFNVFSTLDRSTAYFKDLSLLDGIFNKLTAIFLLPLSLIYLLYLKK